MVFGRRKRGDDLVHSPKRLRRSLWVGWKPNGVGEQKPNHYSDIGKVAWENRRNLPWAWRILSKGVCDGCALGVAGFHDWTISGVHLCTTRLELLKVNTARCDPRRRPGRRRRAGEAQTGASCASSGGSRTRWCGTAAIVGSAACPGTTRSTWSRPGSGTRARTGSGSTSPRAASRTRCTTPRRRRLASSGRTTSTTRRACCHAPSTNALKETLGVAATTCNYRDVIESDLIVLFGADVANAQPVFMKYLYLAKKRGACVAVVNPLREPGLEHYWVPSSVESAMFGTKMADEFFGVHTGGDVAFLNGVMKVLLAIGGIDKEFVRAHTTGFDSLLDQLEEESFDRLEARVGRDACGHDAVRARCTRTRNRPCSCGRWASRNTSPASTTSRRS